MGVIRPRPVGHYGEDLTDLSDSWVRNQRGNQASRDANQSLSNIDDVLKHNTVNPEKYKPTVVPTSPSVRSRAANFLWGAEDWGKAARAAARGDFRGAASSAAWGALAAGSTIGSAFVGPEAKLGAAALQAGRAVKAAEGLSAAQKVGKAAKSIAAQAAVTEALSVGGQALTQRFDKPDATPTSPNPTPSPYSPSNNSNPLTLKPEASVSSQFAKIPRVH